MKRILIIIGLLTVVLSARSLESNEKETRASRKTTIRIELKLSDKAYGRISSPLEVYLKHKEMANLKFYYRNKVMHEVLKKHPDFSKIKTWSLEGGESLILLANHLLKLKDLLTYDQFYTLLVLEGYQKPTEEPIHKTKIEVIEKTDTVFIEKKVVDTVVVEKKVVIEKDTHSHTHEHVDGTVHSHSHNHHSDHGHPHDKVVKEKSVTHKHSHKHKNGKVHTHNHTHNDGRTNVHDHSHGKKSVTHKHSHKHKNGKVHTHNHTHNDGNTNVHDHSHGGNNTQVHKKSVTLTKHKHSHKHKNGKTHTHNHTHKGSTDDHDHSHK